MSTNNATSQSHPVNDSVSEEAIAMDYNANIYNGNRSRGQFSNTLSPVNFIIVCILAKVVSCTKAVIC